MSIKDITVVITSFKSNEKIISCLNSINSQCKVIVVENSNDLKIKQKIENSFSNVQCILSDVNLGYGRANNLGLKNVKTKYALILNPDATLEPSTLENFLFVAKKDLDFAIIGPEEKEEKESKKIPVEKKQKIARNAPCTCGSGKKYKHCHGKVA